MMVSEMFVERMDQRREDLLRERQEIDGQLELIGEMLSGRRAAEVLNKVRDNQETEAVQCDSPRMKVQVDDAKLDALSRLLDLSRMPVWEAAVTLLKEMGQPVPLDSLAVAILIGGKEFGGADPAGSLASHISQKPKRLRQKRGWAYLPEWGEPSV